MRMDKYGWINADGKKKYVDDKMRMESCEWQYVDDEILMKGSELTMFSYSFTCK